MTTPLEYANPRMHRRSARPSLILLAIGLVVVLVASGLLIWVNFDGLWSIPPGTPIRPMALFAANLLGGAAAFALTMVLTLVAVIVGWRWKRIWILALLLCVLALAPFAAAMGTYGWIITVHHLEEKS